MNQCINNLLYFLNQIKQLVLLRPPLITNTCLTYGGVYINVSRQQNHQTPSMYVDFFFHLVQIYKSVLSSIIE